MLRTRDAETGMLLHCLRSAHGPGGFHQNRPLRAGDLVRRPRLLSRGWRGRRVDDHPLCGRCRYDLHASCGPGGELPERCPECGTEPRTFFGVFIGNRRRQPRLAWAGGTLAAVGLVWVVGAAVVSANADQLRRMAPLSMVMEWATPLPEDAQKGAMFHSSGVIELLWQEEILRRLKEEELNAEQVDRVVERALEIQADLSRPIGKWGDIFEAALQNAKVSREQLREYLLHVMVCELVTRPQVLVGDPLPFHIRGTWRGSSDRGGVLRKHAVGGAVSLDLQRLTLGGQSLEPPVERAGWGDNGAWVLASPIAYLGEDAYPRAPAKPGTHSMRLFARVVPRADRGWGGDWGAVVEVFEAAGLEEGWEMELSTGVEIVEPDRAMGIVEGTAAYARFRQDARVSVGVDHNLVHLAFRWGREDAESDPLPMAFKVEIEAAGRTHRLPDFIVRSQDLASGQHGCVEDAAAAEGFFEARPERVRITLTPSADIARRTIDLHRIAVGEPIVLEAPVRYGN